MNAPTYLTRSDAALQGGLARALGVVFLTWPGITIGCGAVRRFLLGRRDRRCRPSVQLGTIRRDGIVQIVRMVLDVAAAVVVIAYPGPSAEALTIIIGVYAIVIGVIELSGSEGPLARATESSGFVVAAGVLSIIAGVLLVIWPEIGVLTLAFIFGVYLAAYGAVLLASAVMAPKGGTVPNPVG